MVRVSSRSFDGDARPLAVSVSVSESGDDSDWDETETAVHAASAITYDNSGSGLTATDVQAAIDELAAGAGTAALEAAVFGVVARGNLGATETIDASAGGYHYGTLDADCTLSFTGATAGVLAQFLLELTEDGTGGWDPTWPGSVVWIGGTPVHDTTPGSTTVYGFWSRDGGTTWMGYQAGAGGSVAALDDLTDVNAPSPSDGDVLTWDATPGEWVAAPSSVTAEAIAALGFVGPLLISDTPSTPLVFADLIQTEAQDDLVYADL